MRTKKQPPQTQTPQPEQPTSKVSGKNGVFRPEYAAKHDWKMDQGLADGILDMIGNSSGRTIADFGAGVGLYVKHFRKHSHRSIGFDGISGIEQLSNYSVSHADLSVAHDYRIKWDWVVSLEVGAYIPKDRARAFVGNLVGHCVKGVVCTWQQPDTKGAGHANPLTAEQLTELFKSFGFVPDMQLRKFIYRKANRRIRNRVHVFVPAASAGKLVTHK